MPMIAVVRSTVALLAATLLFGTIPARSGSPAPPVSPTATSPRWTTLLAGPGVFQTTGIAIDRHGSAKATKLAYTFDAATRGIVKFGTHGNVLGAWAYGPATRRAPAALTWRLSQSREPGRRGWAPSLSRQ